MVYIFATNYGRFQFSSALHAPPERDPCCCGRSLTVKPTWPHGAKAVPMTATPSPVCSRT